jgi:hypothetical protein
VIAIQNPDSRRKNQNTGQRDFKIEHEREGNIEDVEFQFKWER